MIEVETGDSVHYVRVANSFESLDVTPATPPVAFSYYLSGMSVNQHEVLGRYTQTSLRSSKSRGS